MNYKFIYMKISLNYYNWINFSICMCIQIDVSSFNILSNGEVSLACLDEHNGALKPSEHDQVQKDHKVLVQEQGLFFAIVDANVLKHTRNII